MVGWPPRTPSSAGVARTTGEAAARCSPTPPAPDTFALARDRARDCALAVVEGFSTPLRGWAVDVGALDLLTFEPTPDERPQELLEELDRLAFYGNNSWGDTFGRDRARDILGRLDDAGLLDRDLVLGAMLARGASKRGYDQLIKFLDKL